MRPCGGAPRLALAATLIVLVAAAINGYLSYSQGDEDGFAVVRVRVGGSIEATVGGVEVLLRQGDNLVPASTLCISDTVMYVGEGVRLSFRGWLSQGELVSREPCIELEPGDVVEPLFIDEVLVTVVSSPRGIFSYVAWVERGEEVVIKPPGRVEAESAVYTLSHVRGPATLDSDGTVAIQTYGPVNVELVYTSLYRVVVMLSLYGLEDLEYWVPGGGESIVRVPESIETGDGVRLLLSGVDGVNLIARIIGGGIVAVRPQAPDATLIPIYTVIYRLKYSTAEGVKVEWLPRGSQAVLTAPEIIDLSPDAGIRLVFKGWRGDVESLSPTVTVIMEGPVEAEAVYAR